MLAEEEAVRTQIKNSAEMFHLRKSPLLRLDERKCGLMSLSFVRQVVEDGQKTSFIGDCGAGGGGLPLLHGELASVFFISSRARGKVKFPSLPPFLASRSLTSPSPLSS